MRRGGKDFTAVKKKKSVYKRRAELYYIPGVRAWWIFKKKRYQKQSGGSDPVGTEKFVILSSGRAKRGQRARGEIEYEACKREEQRWTG